MNNVVKNNFMMFKLIWKATPNYVLGSVASAVLQNLLSAAVNVFLIREIFNGFTDNKKFSEVIVILLVLLFTYFVTTIYNSWFNNLFTPLSHTRIYEYLNSMIYKKAKQVELACYENPEFYDKYVRAASEANGRGIEVVNQISNFIGFVFSLIAVGSYIAILEPILFILLIVPFLLNTVIGRKINTYNMKYYTKKYYIDRRCEYVKRTMYLADYAKDIRLSSIFNVLEKRFNDAIAQNYALVKKYCKKICTIRGLNEAVQECIMTVLTLLIIAYKVTVTGVIKIGDAVALINAFRWVAGTMRKMSDIYVKLEENALFLGYFRDFMEYEPKLKNVEFPKDIPNTGELKFENVSFSYTENSECVLKNINLTIKKGQKIAIVGYNGAGKSTLIKLAMRLYDPIMGKITYGGIDIKELDIDSYRNTFCSVFQDFPMFSLTIAENVLMREVNKSDDADVWKALGLAGIALKIKNYEKGIDTVLTREFEDNGAVLSGGEAQKIAISRVFAKSASLPVGNSIVILDEPSSALDPYAENHIYKSINNSEKENTVIFISHRLSSVKTADKIYMLENGEIIETGTHDELVLLNKKYCDMFSKQAAQYVESGQCV